MTTPDLDAIVVGAGPNGLAAALTLARAGRSVRVYEAAATIGGGTRTAELTLPGFRHDICSTILPLTAGLAVLPDDRLGRPRRRAHPSRRAARPRPRRRARGRARALVRGDRGRPRPGPTDRRWRRLAPAVRSAGTRRAEAVRGAPAVPSSTCRATRWRWPGSACRRCARRRASPEAGSAARRRGRCSRASPRTRCSRSTGRCRRPFGLVLGMYAHAVGWPMIRGGSAGVSDALAAELRALGGEIVTGERVDRLDQLPAARAVLFDTTPRPWSPSPATACRRGPGAGTRRSATARACSRSIGRSMAPSRGPPTACGARRTVHLGGTLDEVARSESDVAARPPSRAAVHAARPVPPVGPDPGARREDDGLGVLPRPVRLDRRHDRPDRGPGRALRAGLPRPDPRAGDTLAGAARGPRRELHRRRHQRRDRRHPPAPLPPGPAAWTPTTRARGCTSAPHRPRLAAASTG